MIISPVKILQKTFQCLHNVLFYSSSIIYFVIPLFLDIEAFPVFNRNKQVFDKLPCTEICVCVRSYVLKVESTKEFWELSYVNMYLKENNSLEKTDVYFCIMNQIRVYYTFIFSHPEIPPL